MPPLRRLTMTLVLLGLAGCGDAVGGGAGAGPAWFEEIGAARGLDFVHDAGATGHRALPEIMGGGAALFDADGDGDLDLYFTNGSGRLRGAPTPSLRNRLYRQGPGGRFTDDTDASGLGDPGYGMGVAVADYDNDGDLDVFLANYGPDRLYRNRGDGTFEDVSEASGIGDAGWGSSAAFLDYDRDGHLDLYVARYVTYRDKPCHDEAGRPDYCGPKEFSPQTDLLLHNRGDGTFEDVSARAGITSVAAAGLGVVIDDFDGDGWIDVYVANDAYANQLWMNGRDGSFRDDAMLAGTALNLSGQAEAGMGVVAADLDSDLDPDLYVTHLVHETNTLYRNAGDGSSFQDDTGPAGLGPSSMALTGFGTAALDVENDGDLDLVVVNGRVFAGPVRPAAALAAPWNEYAEPNLLYLNDGAGRFAAAEGAAGPLSAAVEISRALVVGDIDGDGGLDLLVSNIQGPARLYRGVAPHRGHWIAIRAVDPRVRRDAIGARVIVEAGGRRWRCMISGAGSYLAAGPARAHVGLGAAATFDAIEVRWPDGAVERFPGGAADRAIEVVRGEGRDAT